MAQARPYARAAALAAALCAMLLCAAAAPAQDTVGSGPAPRPQGAGGPDGGAAGPVDYTRPFQAGEVTQKALILSKPVPYYTEEARANDTWGVVRLRALLTSTGEVTAISVIKGLPDGLTRTSIAAARDIRFRPAQKDGRVVSQWVTLEYEFDFFDDEEKVERKAKILKKPKAEYTEEARRQKVEGKVVLLVALRRDGTARVSSVVEGLPHGLTEKAVEAVRRIEFTPAARGSRDVSVLRRIEYRFSLP